MTTKATIQFEKWPEVLMIARHGQSEANVRKEAFKKQGLEPSWTGALRDQDSPLTELGHKQGRALGEMIAQAGNIETSDEAKLLGIGMGAGYFRPDVILCSPYLRAKETKEEIIRGMNHTPRVVTDVRLREIDFGSMDGIDRATFRKLYPHEADRRERDGKFYYRPPGGENRPDVMMRVHSVLDTLNRDYVGEKVLIVCHSVVVLAFRALLERWEEADYLQVDKEDDVKNAALTVYQRIEHRKLVLTHYNLVGDATLYE